VTIICDSHNLLLNFVQRLLPSSGQETTYTFTPLDRAILCYWAPNISKRVKICTREQIWSMNLWLLYCGLARF